ncbi:copper resistance protein B [Altericroceibacterium spongiae]|uniref:Copper resistance protein B n=1 Tax=Altericroceibacterium spongiae TaxID=2320269 RepID=A0A420EPS1_9SPHN|nr:copper resistance protein B [Altericroceibacterium spongiae]RKF22667.1 copper resistance protein B [Altericroceibacterium spongiae]
MRYAICLLPLTMLPVPAIAQAQETPAAGDEAGTMEHSQMQQGEMDQAEMNHSHMDHARMEQMDMTSSETNTDASIPQSPPPPAAFDGPLYAADEVVGAERMNSSRLNVMRQVSGMPVTWFQAERAEYRARKGGDGYLWDVQGYYGGDYDKLWLKSEGEGTFGEKVEDAEIQALWSHAIGPWFDLQTGVRQDLTGPTRTHATIGVQGLIPYEFEVDAAAFLSNKGDLTARIEAELDQRITQRLILQPRGEVELSAQDIPEAGIGAGLHKAELGLRLRYEFTREFAPYIGVEQEWKIGDSADYARAEGEDPSTTNYVAGIRFWF